MTYIHCYAALFSTGLQHVHHFLFLKSITLGPSEQPPTSSANSSSGLVAIIHRPVDLCFIILPCSIISPFFPDNLPLLIILIESPEINTVTVDPNDFPDHSANATSYSYVPFFGICPRVVAATKSSKIPNNSEIVFLIFMKQCSITLLHKKWLVRNQVLSTLPS